MFLIQNDQNRCMKRYVLSIILAVIALCSLPAFALSQQTSLLFVGNRDYPPMAYLEEGMAKGFYVDVTRAIAGAAGKDIDIRLMAWHEAQKMVLEDRADAVISMSITDARKDLFDYSNVVTLFEFCLFLREGTIGISGLNDLVGKPVAVFRGGLPHQLLQGRKDLTVVPVDSHLEGFELLKAGSVAALATDKWVGSYTIHKHGIENVTLLEEPFAVQESAIAVKKGNRALLSEINLGLGKIQATGELSQIKEKWWGKKIIFTTQERQRALLIRTALIAAAALVILLAGWIILLKKQIRRRKKAETERNRYFDLSPDMLCIAGFDGTFRELNPAWEKTLGWTPVEMKKRPWLDFVHPDDHAATIDVGEKMLRGEIVLNFENRYRCKDGSYKWILWNSYPLVEDRLIFGAAHDVTRRKTDEESLKVSELRYRELFNRTSKCAIVVRRLPGQQDFTIVDINTAACEAEGIGRNEALDRSLLALFPAVEPSGLLDMIERIDATGVAQSYPVAVRKKGLIITWCEYFIYKLPTEEIVLLYEYLTESKKMEEELRQSEERFRNLFNNIVEGIYQTTPGGRYLSVNEAQARIYGYDSPQEMMASVTDIGHQLYADPQDRERFLSELNRDGQVSDFEFRALRKDGSIIWVTSNARAVKNASGHVAYYEGTNIDITYRKTIENRQKLVNQVFEAAGSIKDIKDLVHKIIDLIRTHTLIEAAGIRLSDGGDYPYYETAGFEPDFVEKERLLCRYDQDGQIVRDPTGKPYLDCMCGNVLSGRIDPSVPFFTPGGSFWTNSTTQLLSATTEEDRQARTRNRCNGEGYESVALIPLKAGEDIVGLLQLNDRRESRFTLDMIEHLEGIGATVGAAISRLRAEEALREAQETIERSFENANIGVCFIDLDGRFLKVNREMCDILGYSREELEGKDVSEITYPGDQSVKDAMLRKTLREGSVRNVFEKRYHHKDGHIVQCIVASSLIRDRRGTPLYHIAHVQDITEQKKMKERLGRAEKMEALGILAGGVAHDLNNVIGIILGYSEMLLDELDADHAAAPHARSIMSATERASAVVQDLLTMARRNVAASQVLNLNRIIKEYLASEEMQKNLLRHPAVRIESGLAEDLFNMKGSSIHLSKTLMNLVVNALEAMPGGGTITLGTRNLYLEKPIGSGSAFREGDYVVLTVSDTGEGIKPEDQPHIFEPFYTRKVMGRSGTGLGLAIVWGTVHDHQGQIDVTSSPGRGTTFTLSFPAVRDDETQPAQALDRSAYMGRGETILVVDDLPEQRNLAAGLLKKLNYSAVTAQSGEDAVDYLRTNSVDLIVLDMIMDPGIDGLETYRRALALRPDQKAIIVSGFAETDRVVEAQRLGAGAYVRKPYLMETLGLAVRKELDKTTS